MKFNSQTEKEDIDQILNKIGIGKFHFILILILGIILASDSIEILILAFMWPIFECIWRINVFQISFLTIAVFIGLMFGSILLGKFSDNYGRKPTLMLGIIGMIYFSLLSAFTPTIIWMIVIRSAVGFFIGGNAVVLNSLLMESTPIKYRGILTISLSLFWALGSYLITTLSYFILPRFGWQILIMTSTIPALCTSVSLMWLPESPRYLLFRNDEPKCLEVLNKIAKLNNSPFVENVHEEPTSHSSFKDLFHKRYLTTTILITYLWFISGLSYFSLVLIITVINKIPHKCLQDMSKFSNIQINKNNVTIDNSCCTIITWETYVNMFISTTAEIASLPITTLLITFIGRKTVFGIYLLIQTLCIFLLNLCLSVIQLNILLFFTRGSISAFHNVLFLYTSEVFPTSVRSFGLGLGYGCNKIGSMLSTIIVNIIMQKYSFIGGTLILFILDIIGLIIIPFIPYETKSRKLFQTASQDNKEDETIHLIKKR